MLAGDKPGTDSPLPSWLRFDPVSGTFSGQPPADAPAVIKIRVVARDSNGNEATATIVINRASGKEVSGKVMPGKDLLHLLAKRVRHGEQVATDAGDAANDALDGSTSADAEAAGASAAALAARLADGSKDSSHDATHSHAAQLSQQLQEAKHSFYQKGASTLRHIATVQQQRTAAEKVSA